MTYNVFSGMLRPAQSGCMHVLNDAVKNSRTLTRWTGQRHCEYYDIQRQHGCISDVASTIRTDTFCACLTAIKALPGTGGH